MGGTVGMVLGFLYGSFHIIRFGPGPNGMLRTIGQYMAGSGATFGYVWYRSGEKKSLVIDNCFRFFMAIGHTIRTDSTRAGMLQFHGTERRPIILPSSFIYPKRKGP